MKLMKQKGVILMNTWIHLIGSMKKKLPTKDDFYSLLNDEHISDVQYVHAIANFRKTCMQYYELYRCYYFTSPELLVLGYNVEND